MDNDLSPLLPVLGPSSHHVLWLVFVCLFVFLHSNGNDKRLYSVFHRHQSVPSLKDCVSELGTSFLFFSSTVPVTFVLSSTVLYASWDTDLNVHCHFLCDVFALMLVLLNSCHFFHYTVWLLLLLFYLSTPTVILLNWIHTHTEQLTTVSFFVVVSCPIRCWWTMYLYFGCDALNTEFLSNLNVPLITLRLKHKWYGTKKDEGYVCGMYAFNFVFMSIFELVALLSFQSESRQLPSPSLASTRG